MRYRVQILHGSSYGQSEQNTKVLILTQPFFERQIPDFALKLIWIVRTKYRSTKSTKVLITQPFFELQTPDFAWKFIWTVQPNDKVQKVQKYKRTKVQNYESTKVQNRKVQKIKK